MTTMPLSLATSAVPRSGIDPFSVRLRNATSTAHTDAEGARYIHRLLAGELTQQEFALLSAQHLYIYRALELVGRELATDPLAGPFVDERLERVASLEVDLAYFHGHGWRDVVSPLPATAAYVQRLLGLMNDPVRFIAHHYVRYLGDLSGGRALGRIVARTHDLREGQPGLLFYHFDQITAPKPYKDDYRCLLNEANLRPSDQQDLIAEAVAAFELNAAVFADLDAALSSAN